MASILTNAAAMAALQTLRSIDRDLETTQARVSSGLRVETAADNAAYWSIATTMRSDNRALSTVQDALGLGAAKIDTAYAALDSAITNAQEIKQKLVAAYGVGVDRAKIAEEISQLQDQLKSISESASFSGENWLQEKISDGGTPPVARTVDKQVVASFIRNSAGNVAVTTVNYPLNESTVLFDLSGGKFGILDKEAMFVAKDEAKITVTETNAGVVTKTDYAVPAFSDETVKALGADTNTTDAAIYTVGGNSYLKVADNAWVKVTTTAPAGPATTTPAHVGSGPTNYYFDLSTSADLSTRNLGISASTLDINNLAAIAAKMNAMDPGKNYTDEDALDVMIQFVDTQIEAMTSAASSLGSIQSRIDMQEDFVATLIDTIDQGIGRLVDADMNEESTRLKALQTQQQLGIQALSIANTNSENILQLFRQ